MLYKKCWKHWRKAILLTLTSIISSDSRSDLSLENCMNFFTSNICLEASFLERECAPKTTFEDWPLADLKTTKRKKLQNGSQIPQWEGVWKRPQTCRKKDLLQGDLPRIRWSDRGLRGSKHKWTLSRAKWPAFKPTWLQFPSIAREYQNLYLLWGKKTEILIDWDHVYNKIILFT